MPRSVVFAFAHTQGNASSKNKSQKENNTIQQTERMHEHVPANLYIIEFLECSRNAIH